MTVPAVFISSVVEGFEDVRAAAAAAIQGIRMYPIRSEELSADPESSRRALLDQVAGAEYYLLLLGARYGDYGAGEKSPTEDEYDEAVRLGRPILVLVQECELEPRQQEFLERIRGSWEEGVFYGTFAGAADVGTRVAAALARQQSAIVEDGPAAQERALALAAGERNYGWSGSLSARIAFTPLRQTTLLDPVALEQPGLGDDVIAALRGAGAIPQSVGIEATISSAGLKLGPPSQQSGPESEVAADGAIAISGPIGSEGMLGGMVIDPARLESLILASGRAAKLIWDRIDTRSEVGQVALVAAVLGAEHAAYGPSSSGSVSMGGSIPAVLLAPDPPQIIARGQLDQEALAHQVLASIRRVFADAGRVQS
jgi:hypothetical protein